MLEVTIFEVGQGDAILIKWQDNDTKKIGIIDCNRFKGPNKIIEFINTNSIKEIEFIVLSHFHYDHFSGFSDIFKYCIANKVRIINLYHTFTSLVLDIYNQIFYSKKIESEIEEFMSALELLEIENLIITDCHTKSLDLAKNITLSFYAPDSKTYLDIAKKVSRKRNRIVSTNADINKLSTIIEINKDSDSILFTSDAPKKSFDKIYNKVKTNIVWTQIPHHGSSKNISEKFWENVITKRGAPAVLSIGDEPKDKLPDKETIEYYVSKNFKIFSTNPVYGICEYFDLKNTRDENKTTCLDMFSTKIKTINKGKTSDQFNGDKIFKLLY